MWHKYPLYSHLHIFIYQCIGRWSKTIWWNKKPPDCNQLVINCHITKGVPEKYSCHRIRKIAQMLPEINCCLSHLLKSTNTFLKEAFVIILKHVFRPWEWKENDTNPWGRKILLIKWIFTATYVNLASSTCLNTTR